MPYSQKTYKSREKYGKYKSCVKKVSKKENHVNPYAVCRSSVYKEK